MSEEKREFNLQKKYIFLIIILGIIFISVSMIFFKGNILNHHEEKLIKKEDSLADKLLKENIKVVDDAENFSQFRLRMIDETDYVLGDKNAKIKIIYYSDFDAPFNEDMFKNIDQIRKEFPGTVIAYRYFPMSNNQFAFSSALSVECASEQGKFWEMARALVDDKTKGKLNEDNFFLRAEDLGLNIDNFKKCMKEEKYMDKIKKQMEEGIRFGVSGAPTIFVNEIILPGAYPFEDFTDSTGRDRKGLKTIIENEMNEKKIPSLE